MPGKRSSVADAHTFKSALEVEADARIEAKAQAARDIDAGLDDLEAEADADGDGIADDSESSNFDEDVFMHEDEDSDNHDEEVGRNKLLLQERAKASCPIRTRYLPDWEKDQEKQNKGKPVKQAAPDAVTSSPSGLSRMMSSKSNGLNRTVSERLFRAARKAKRSFKRKGKQLKAEGHAIQEAATKFTETAFDDFKQGGDGADRILAEIVGNAYHFDPADMQAMGVVGGQLQSLMRARAFEELEAKTGLIKGPSPFQLMQTSGRFFCNNKSQGATDLDNIALLKELAVPRFQKSRKPGISREEVMAMLSSGEAVPGTHEGSHKEGEFHKGSLSMSNVEDVWWSNCKGQAAIRRKPEEHEAVFDFSDNRITMPKNLGGGHAGQLVTVKPDIHKHGLMGEVTMTTCVPKRAHVRGVADNLNQKPDNVTLELGADVHKGVFGLKRHAHLTPSALPPSSKSWLDWRDAQIAKRRAAFEAALAAGKAAGKLEEERKNKAGAAEDFHSQGGSVDEEAVAVMSDIMSGRKTDEASARGSARQAPEPATNARRGRRQGLDMASLMTDETRWDARMPPNPAELKRVLAKCVNMSKHGKDGGMSFAAHEHREASKKDKKGHTIGMGKKVDEMGMAEEDSLDPFANELEERVWILRTVEEDEDETRNVNIVFAVQLEGGFAYEELEEVPEHLVGEDDPGKFDPFWEDIFRPVPRTWMEQVRDMFGMIDIGHVRKQ